MIRISHLLACRRAAIIQLRRPIRHKKWACHCLKGDKYDSGSGRSQRKQTLLRNKEVPRRTREIRPMKSVIGQQHDLMTIHASYWRGLYKDINVYLQKY